MRDRGEHAAVVRPGPIPWPPPGAFEERGPGSPPSYPPKGWPTKAQLDYTQQAIVVGLLVLALPWLIGRLATDPGSVLAGVGRKQTGA